MGRWDPEFRAWVAGSVLGAAAATAVLVAYTAGLVAVPWLIPGPALVIAGGVVGILTWRWRNG